MLTGKLSHNTYVVNNSASRTGVKYPGNCTSPDWAENMEPHALAVHMHVAGYHSIYMGKYMNDAHQPGSVPPAYENDTFAYIPPGWSEWYGLQGNSKCERPAHSVGQLIPFHPLCSLLRAPRRPLLIAAGPRHLDYNYSVSNNGTREDHGHDYEKDYFTLQLAKRVSAFFM